MHEYSLVASVLERVQEIAEAEGNLPVTQVKLEIGVFQEVEPELLVWAFDVAKEATLAENATLSWSSIPPKLCCDACHVEYTPEDIVFWECPTCHGRSAVVLAGDELIIRSIALEAP